MTFKEFVRRIKCSIDKVSGNGMRRSNRKKEDKLFAEYADHIDRIKDKISGNKMEMSDKELIERISN